MYKSNLEPDISLAVGSLSNSSTDDLKNLLNDDTKFEEIIKRNAQLLNLESAKEDIMVKNRSLAEFNLSKEPELEEAKRSIQSLSEEGNQLCLSVQAKLDEITSNGGSLTKDNALELLQTAASEIEAESEKVAEKFLGGEMEVDDFLDEFLIKRKLMHMRKVKVDKMKELMRKPSVYPKIPDYPIVGMYDGSMPMPVPNFKPF